MLQYIGQQVDAFLAGTEGPFPALNLEAAAMSGLGYEDGTLVRRGLTLSWKQIEPTLPPAQLSGSIPATAVSTGNVRRALLRPDMSILPREQWPSIFPAARVRATQADWDEICIQLHRRRIVKFLRSKELTWHGDDFLGQGTKKALDWLDRMMTKEFSTKLKGRIGPEAGLEVGFLHRILRFIPGYGYE